MMTGFFFFLSVCVVLVTIFEVFQESDGVGSDGGEYVTKHIFTLGVL